MNKRTLKLAQKIIKKAIQVNSREEYSVFVYYMGHVNGLNVDIHENGWVEGSTPQYSITVYLDNDETEEMLQIVYDAIKEVK